MSAPSCTSLKTLACVFYTRFLPWIYLGSNILISRAPLTLFVPPHIKKSILKKPLLHSTNVRSYARVESWHTAQTGIVASLWKWLRLLEKKRARTPTWWGVRSLQPAVVKLVIRSRMHRYLTLNDWLECKCALTSQFDPPSPSTEHNAITTVEKEDSVWLCSRTSVSLTSLSASISSSAGCLNLCVLIPPLLRGLRNAKNIMLHQDNQVCECMWVCVCVGGWVGVSMGPKRGGRWA